MVCVAVVLSELSSVRPEAKTVATSVSSAFCGVDLLPYGGFRYSDTSANEGNSFRKRIRLAEIFVSRNVIPRRFL